MCSVTAWQVALTAYASYYTAESQENQGKYESGVAKYNKRVAENTAQRVQDKGTKEENIQREKTAQLLAKQRAQLGAANVGLETGTALQLQQDTVTLGEADALRVRSNTEFKVQSLLTKGELLGYDAENALTAGKNKATGSLLSGAASVSGSGVADKWFSPNSSAKTSGASNGAGIGASAGRR